jgi:hypothetical protein
MRLRRLLILLESMLCRCDSRPNPLVTKQYLIEWTAELICLPRVTPDSIEFCLRAWSIERSVALGLTSPFQFWIASWIVSWPLLSGEAGQQVVSIHASAAASNETLGFNAALAEISTCLGPLTNSSAIYTG